MTNKKQLKQKAFIVIVNHNGHLDTIECLENIFIADHSNNFQVTVVDNSDSEHSIKTMIGWAEGRVPFQQNHSSPLPQKKIVKKPLNYKMLFERELVKRDYSEKLLFIRAKENKGFAAANNIALKYIQKFGAKEDLIWLLNNDTILSKGTVQEVISKFNSYKGEKHKALFGTPLLEYYDPNIIQAVGGKYNKFFGLTRHIGAGLELKKRVNINQFKVDYPVGASMLVTKFFLETVGLLNEEYFLFFEEIDWALRARKKGCVVKILDVYGVYHKQGKSTKNKDKNKGLKNEFIDLTQTRNRIVFSKIFYKKYIYSVAFSILTITVINRIRKGGFKRAGKLFKMVIKEIF